MCSIDVKVSELKKMIDELVKDRVDYVTLSILEEDEFSGVVFPKSLHFEAFDGFGGGVDYEFIEEVVVDPHYKIMTATDCSICGNRIKTKDDLIFEVIYADGVNVSSERVLCRACSQKVQKELWEY